MLISEFVPVSTFQKDYSKIVRSLPDGPVILSQYTKAVAVVMTPDEYERLIRADVELKRLQRIIQYDQDFAAMRGGEFVEG